MACWEEAKTVLITDDMDRTLRQGVLVGRRVRREAQQARRGRLLAQAAAGGLAWLMTVAVMSFWAWLWML